MVKILKISFFADDMEELHITELEIVFAQFKN